MRIKPGWRGGGSPIWTEKVAVIGKFGQRNHSQEIKAGEIISQIMPDAQIELGHRVTGQLNFPRRAATTLLTAATKDSYREFTEQVARALKERMIWPEYTSSRQMAEPFPWRIGGDACGDHLPGPAASIMGVLLSTPVEDTLGGRGHRRDHHRPCFDLS